MKNIDNIVKKVLSEISNNVISEQKDPYQFSKVKPLWNKHIKEYVSPAYVDYKSVPEKFIWVKEVDGVWVSKFGQQNDPFNSKQKDYGDELVKNQIYTLQSIVKGKTLYFRDLNFDSDFNTIENIKLLGDYNRERAEKFFGRQCKKISGTHPTYNVGYNYNIDYYVDGLGNKCYPKPYKETTIDASSGKTYKQREFNQKVKTIKLKNGNNVDISKNQYDPQCKPITYENCLRVSWDSLDDNNNLSGVYEFEVKSGLIRNKYRALMTEEWFPWYNRFVGYYDIENTGSPYLTKYNTWEIARGDTTFLKTGVEIMEEKLGNFSSKDYSSLPVLDVENFTSSELFDTYLLKQQNIKPFKTESSNTLVRNVFTHWNTVNKYYSSGYLSDYEDLNTNSELDGLLKDLYGLEDKDKIGFDQTDEEFYTLNDINALEIKYEDIYKQKGLVGTLSTIAKDLSTEKKSKKVSGSTLYENYLKFKWDDIISLDFQGNLALVLTDAQKFKGCFTDAEITSPYTKGLALAIMSTTSPKKIVPPLKSPNTNKKPNYLSSIFQSMVGGIKKVKEKMGLHDVVEECPKLVFPNVKICPLPKDYENLDQKYFKIDKGKLCTIESSPDQILKSLYFVLNGATISDLGLSVPFNVDTIQNITATQLNDNISGKSEEENESGKPTKEQLQAQLEMVETFNKELSIITSTKFLIFAKPGKKEIIKKPTTYKEKEGYDFVSGDYIGSSGIHYPIGPKY